MRKVGFILILVVLLVAIPNALAGNWASVTLDEPPGEIHAGDPWVVGLTVLRHDVTPIHSLGPGAPVEPTFVATHAATGERVEAVARPDKEIGRFTLEVTFPSDGEWEWTIYPAPLAGDEQRQSLTVLPSASAETSRVLSVSALGGASLPAVIGIIALVVALGVAPWLYARRESRPRVGLEGEG